MPHHRPGLSQTVQIPPEELAAFVGPNAEKYLRKWGTERPESKVNWHWVAFFFAPFWLAYRKMYLWLFGLLVVASINILFIPRIPADMINLIIAVLAALFAYPLYYRHTRANIARIKVTCTNPAALAEELKRAGGTSPLALTFTIVGYVAVSIVAVVFYFIVGFLSVANTQTSTSQIPSVANTAVNMNSSSAESSMASIDPATVIVGTSFDEASPDLNVSGTDYHVGKDLYARVAAPASDNAFSTVKLTFRLEKRDGQSWAEVDTTDVDVKPEWNVYVEPFSVPESGTYLIRVLKGSEVYGEVQFDVKP